MQILESLKTLQNKYRLATFGFYADENEPSKLLGVTNVLISTVFHHLDPNLPKKDDHLATQECLVSKRSRRSLPAKDNATFSRVGVRVD